MNTARHSTLAGAHSRTQLLDLTDLLDSARHLAAAAGQLGAVPGGDSQIVDAVSMAAVEKIEAAAAMVRVMIEGASS